MSEIVERTREDRFEELFREHYRAGRGYALRLAPGDLAHEGLTLNDKTYPNPRAP